ncbi:MAG: hypothetical protein ABSG51_02465 [Terracidiphilus sp.]
MQIDDPLVERLYAVIAGQPEGAGVGAVNRLNSILSLYYGSGATPLPVQMGVRVSPVTDPASDAMALAKESLDRVIQLRDA